MRLTAHQIELIRQAAREIGGEQARVTLFGSRVDDSARGGDIDLMVEIPHAVENPALLAARISARLSRAMNGRKIDILLSAPNLRRLPIHEVACRQGVPL